MTLKEDFFIGMRPDIQLSLEGANTVLLGGRTVGDLDMDEEARNILATLLPLLDGSRELRALRQQALKPDLASSTIDNCLLFLSENGFLYQYRNAADAGHAARYSSRTSRPDVYLERIAGAAVLLVGKGVFSSMLEESCVATSIGKVNSLASWDHEPDFLPHLLIASDLSRTDASSINSWCQHKNIPILTSWLDRDVLCFSPLVLPGKTACIECVFSAIPQSSYFPSPRALHFLPGLHPLAVSAASLIAGLILDFLSGFGVPEYFTCFNRFNLGTGRISSIRVLKNPRCPACGRLQRVSEGVVAGV